jgi:hypothetical protein
MSENINTPYSPALSTRSKKAFQPLSTTATPTSSTFSPLSPAMFSRSSLSIPSPVPFSPLYPTMPYSPTPSFSSPFLSSPTTITPTSTMNSYLMAMNPRTSTPQQHCGTTAALMALPQSPMSSYSFLNPLQMSMLGPKTGFEMFPSGPI